MVLQTKDMKQKYEVLIGWWKRPSCLPDVSMWMKSKVREKDSCEQNIAAKGY